MEEILDRVQTTLILRMPFISSLLREARIIKTRAIPRAGVSARGWIYVNDEWLKKQDFRTQVFVFAHEVLHAASFHPRRTEGKNKSIWNTATDCVVNHLLSEMFHIPDEYITPQYIAQITNTPSEEVQKMSDIEVYELLMKFLKKTVSTSNELIANDLLDEEKEGVVISDGAPFNDQSPEENRDGWLRAISKAYIAQKTAGKIPAGLERWVEGIIKPKINPRTLLKQSIRNGLGRLVINTWRRTHRKIPDVLPGNRMLTIPTIWCLVDTSGSIGESELKMSLGVCFEFANVAKLKVICWDAEAYETIPVRNKTDVLNTVAKKIQGGGGTVIAPVLRRVLSEMMKKDIVVVVTDGYIYDLNNHQTKSLLDEVAKRSSTAIVCSHTKDVSIVGWRSIKLTPTNFGGK